MPEERKEFSFTADELGIVSTDTLDPRELGENFLNSDPNDIKFVPPTSKKTSKKEEDEDEMEDEDEEEVVVEDKKKAPKQKEKKSKEEPTKEVKEDELFTAMESKAAEEGKPTQTAQSQQDQGSGEEAQDNTFTTIAKELVNYGIFTPEEDEEGNAVEPQIDTPEEFLQRFELETRRRASNVIERFISKFGDEYADMFDSVFVKGVPPQDYLNRYAKIETVKGIDLADEANQERIVRELYRSEGRSAEYVEKKITQLKNYNDLHDEAIEAQRILVQREEAEIQNAAERKNVELQRKAQIRAEYVNSVNRILAGKIKSKEFDGIPVDQKFAQDTFSYITAEKWETVDKQTLTDFDKDILDLNRPENHELKVKVAMLMQLLKEDPQLTKLAKKAVSKEKSELFQGLKKTAMKSSGKKEPAQDDKPNPWF